MTKQTLFVIWASGERESVMQEAGFKYISSASLVSQLVQHDAATRQSPAVALPSVAAVVEIAHDLRTLLFPDLWLSSATRHLQAAAQECVARVEQRLSTQIAIGLSHVQSTELRLHDASADGIEKTARVMTGRFLSLLPQLQVLLHADIQAAFDRDPAAKTPDEIVLCYPGIQAVVIYRLAHALLTLGVPYLPRILTEWAHRETGIDIHPGADIGPRFFIDHGTGVVIGETCVIGSSVTLYQGVTLGARSFPRDEDGQLIRGTQRHPTLEDGVSVYSNATILGGTTVVGAGSLVGSSVTLSRSIPANTIVTIEKPSLQFRDVA